MKIAVITGASSGMGREFALQMDAIFKNIDEFWLVARREKELEELASVLTHPCRILSMNLTKMGQIERLAYAVKLEEAKVCILVNCAGYGLMGAFESTPLKETVGMVRVNCEALTELTYRMLPYMSKNSRILQLASSAAFLPQADFAVYAATKAYVLSFSRALSRELRDRGIYVTAVCPGPVNTPFFETAEKYAAALSAKKAVMAQPEDVVAKALRDSYRRAEVSVYGMPMNLFRFAAKLLPQGMLLQATELMKKMQRDG